MKKNGHIGLSFSFIGFIGLLVYLLINYTESTDESVKQYKSQHIFDNNDNLVCNKIKGKIMTTCQNEDYYCYKTLQGELVCVQKYKYDGV